MYGLDDTIERDLSGIPPTPPDLVAALKENAETNLAAYEALDSQGKALADLGDWISRQETRRRNAYFFAETEKIRRRVAGTSIGNVRRELVREIRAK